MSFNQENIVAANLSSVDALHAYSSSLLAGASRLLTLNFTVAQSTLGDASSHAKTQLGAAGTAGTYDLHEWQSLQHALLQQGVEKSVAYLRSVQEISRELQEKLLGVLEAQFNEIQKQVAESERYAPAGSDVAIAGVRSAFNAANSAFGSLNKVARQVSDVAEASLSAAGSATVRAVTPTPAARKKAA